MYMARQKLMLCWIGIKVSESRLLTIILVLSVTVFLLQTSLLFQRVMQSYPRDKRPVSMRYSQDNDHNARLLHADDKLYERLKKRAVDSLRDHGTLKHHNKIVIDFNIHEDNNKNPDDKADGAQKVELSEKFKQDAQNNDLKGKENKDGNKKDESMDKSIINRQDGKQNDKVPKQPAPDNNVNSLPDSKKLDKGGQGKPVADNKGNKIVIQYFIYTFKDTTDEYRIRTFKPTPILFEHLDNPTSSYNGNMSLHSPNPMAYLTVTGTKIHMMSAFEGFSIINKTSGQPNVTDDRTSFYDVSTEKYYKSSSALVGQKHIVINTWLETNLVPEKLLCCILLKNNSVVSYLSTQRIAWYMCKKQPLMAAKVYCPIPEYTPGGEQPIGALISPPAFGCYSRIFMNIQRAQKKEPFSLAICAKIAYGELSPHRVIEWMETQKYLGVDKVVYYFYNLNKETMKVLKMYMEEDFVELLPFDIPQPGDPKRDVGQKQGQPYSDEQVATYDCMERLKGYNYIAVIDTDEFIYAKNAKNHNLKTFLKMAAKRYPDASGFSFATEMFVTDWYNSTNISTYHGAILDWPKTELWHSKYRIRTKAMVDRVKSIVNVDRIVLGSVWTHNFTSLHGFQNHMLSYGHASLKHFRACRPQWIEDNSCFKLPKYKDVSMAKLMYSIRDRILLKKEKMLGS